LKGKVISLIVSAAVVLGLLLVPAAMPTMVLAYDSNIGIEVVPQETKVGFGETFDVEVWVTSEGDTYNAAGVRLVYETKYVTCNAVTDSGIWDYTANCLCNNSWNTSAGLGLVKFDATMLGPTWNNDQKVLTVNFTSTSNTSNSGISGLDFIFIPLDDATSVPDAGVDKLNWTRMVNGTLKVGAPALTVTVNPPGGGTVDKNPAPPYSWDQVVTLTAVESTAGWEWDSWSGTDNDGINPTTVTMTDAKNVTANFVEKPPILDVDPNNLDLTARWGGFEDNGTVTISNDGGGTLCWALGTPPVWSVGDVWSYWNSYDEAPPGNPFPNPYYNGALPCPANNTLLNLTVVGEDADNYYAVADWPITDPQRTAKPGIFIPCCLQDAAVVVDKYTLDYVQQLANLTLYLPTPTPGQALVSWSYDSCHGWPYYAGKTWNYNMTITDALGTTVTPAQAMVTGWDVNMSAWIITHGSPNLGGTVFMQQYWSDAVRNFVYQWDGGTFVAPPLDQRTLTAFSVAAPPSAAPPSWLSFDKTHGALGIGGSDVLTVTANSSGLNVTTYSGSFTITAPGSIQSETVTVNLTVTPATTIDVLRDLPADALDYDAEYPGDTFLVYVNFTAPVADFNSIGLTDFAPAGWLVETDNSWCTPAASWNKSNYNKAEYSWAGPFDPPQNFTAVYQVTIPATAQAGLNEWPACMETCDPCGESSNINDYCAWVEYWFAADGPFESSICGDYQKIVTVPGCVRGETRDVNADLLDTVTVVLYEEPLDANPESSDASVVVPTPVNWTDAGGNFTTRYENCADDTGYYYQVASKYCYYTIDTSNMTSPRNVPHPDYIDWSTPTLLVAGYRMDFEGDYGLICKGADMSYAMESINHWLFVPIDQYAVAHSEWQLHSWKAMESIHAWQYPCGCGCI
jgi:hypothetical protein